MMKNIPSVPTILLSLILLAINCTELPYKDQEVEGVRGFGWLADDEDPSRIPVDITPFDGDTAALPPVFHMDHRYPPVGDQGIYGTCVVWSIGYNLNTALNAVEKNLRSGDLAHPSNQVSPADLWRNIPTGERGGGGCNGTKFETAFDALIRGGAKSMADEPYSGNLCGETHGGDDRNRIANYRRIAFNGRLGGSGAPPQGMTVANFKGYLSQGRPIAIGAKLGDRFMSWNSSEVLNGDTRNNPRMQHANHAMALTGYDDYRQAFRVRNSWGAGWGDEGSIWVNYDYFINDFCYVAFVAQKTAANPHNIPVPSINYDLFASYARDWVDEEEGEDERDRAFNYEVYNIGTLPILASQRWTVYYVYYNAYDANDIGIIYEDYYTDEFGQLGDNAIYESQMAIVEGWWNHVNVLPGRKAGEDEWPEGFTITYRMPEITGDYYLLLFADAANVIKESNEDNNYYFITAENGRPIRFEHGVMVNDMAEPETQTSASALGKRTASASVARRGQANAYTPQEVTAAMNNMKRDGRLRKMSAEYRASGGKKSMRAN